MRFLVVAVDPIAPSGPRYGLDVTRALKNVAVRNARTLERRHHRRWAVVTIDDEGLGMLTVEIDDPPSDPTAVPFAHVSAFPSYGETIRDAEKRTEAGTPHFVLVGRGAARIHHVVRTAGGHEVFRSEDRWDARAYARGWGDEANLEAEIVAD